MYKIIICFLHFAQVFPLAEFGKYDICRPQDVPYVYPVRIFSVTLIRITNNVVRAMLLKSVWPVLMGFS